MQQGFLLFDLKKIQFLEFPSSKLSRGVKICCVLVSAGVLDRLRLTIDHIAHRHDLKKVVFFYGFCHFFCVVVHSSEFDWKVKICFNFLLNKITGSVFVQFTYSMLPSCKLPLHIAQLSTTIVVYLCHLQHSSHHLHLQYLLYVACAYFNPLHIAQCIARATQTYLVLYKFIRAAIKRKIVLLGYHSLFLSLPGPVTRATISNSNKCTFHLSTHLLLPFFLHLRSELGCVIFF